jgi:hypothetical protein
MLSQNPLLTMESLSRSNERLRSAILNCICPECGGSLSLAPDQLRCQGRCGADWRPVWTRVSILANKSVPLPAFRSSQLAKHKGNAD